MLSVLPELLLRAQCVSMPAGIPSSFAQNDSSMICDALHRNA